MLIGSILAGGLSSRMGVEKAALRLPITGQSLLEHARHCFHTAGIDNIIISHNQWPEAVADIYPHLGPLSGIHAVCGFSLEHYPSAKGMLFMPVDMPNMSAARLRLLGLHGTRLNQPCCYESQFLPLYLPLSEVTYAYLQRTIVGKQPYSLNAMLTGLGAVLLKIPAASLAADEFININQPHQWAAFQQHLLDSKT